MTLYSKIKRRLLIAYGDFTTVISKVALRLNGVKYNSGLHVRGMVKIYNSGEISIGNNVTINSALWANPISAAGHTCLQVSGGGILEIGDGTGISNSSITCQQQITIGNHVLIGANCQIYDTDFHPLESRYRFGQEKNDNYIHRKPVLIDDGAFIGTETIILKGTHIGRGSIIGAGSIVSGEIPPFEIWAGVPAKYVKKIE